MSVFVFVPIGLRKILLPRRIDLGPGRGQLLALEPGPELYELLGVEVIFHFVAEDLILGAALHELRPDLDLKAFLLCFVFVSDVLIDLYFIFVRNLFYSFSFVFDWL